MLLVLRSQMMNVSSSLRERQQNDMVRIQELEAEVRHAALLSSTRGWEVSDLKLSWRTRFCG